MKKIFVFAGEMSGDLHGSRFIRALKQQDSSTMLSGIGGPLMRQEDFDCFLQMENFQIMGFSSVFLHLPKLLFLFYRVRQFILTWQPDTVLLIDSPAFSLRLAKSLRKQGYNGKIVQYICPSVWAHGKKRISTLTQYFDALLTIYPFEASYFSHSSLQVEYIGNPLVETIQNHQYRSEELEKLKIPFEGPLIGLFPGSRKQEIFLHAPQQLAIAKKIQQEHPHVSFGISCAQKTFEPILRTWIEKSSLKNVHFVHPQLQYELMKRCTLALAKSGTVTLELALHRIPTIVHYELSLVNYMVAKYILRLSLPFYCIVNILSRREIFPEAIDRPDASSYIYTQMSNLLVDAQRRNKIKNECEQMICLLGQHPSAERAARFILEM